jgi:hypothetical protein
MGVKEFEICVDDKVVYRGIANIAAESSVMNKYQELSFK